METILEGGWDDDLGYENVSKVLRMLPKYFVRT